MINTSMKQSLARGWIFFGIILLSLCVNIIHPYLWGPDEPREAEIAREALQNGEYVYSTFNSVPFVEKPPLYYDLAAGAFALTGSLHPGAARMVSALLGALMAGALYLLARHRMGRGFAAIATALLVSMPQFYRATHWILVDIGVGAFVTAALAIYGYWALHPEKRESNGMLILFYLAAACAFLTKGFITLVYLGMVILPFMIYRKKWLPFPLNWTMLFFLLPVAGWIWLFYRAGGIYFLHEHFINNIFGRLLHREFRLPGSPITVSDVGHDTRWSFYLERLPNMFGAAIVFLPPLLYGGILTLRKKNATVFSGKEKRYFRWLDKIFAPFPEADRDWIVYLLCWTFVPIVLFSFSSIKEVTYILPSYAGLALLVAEYLKRFVAEPEAEEDRTLAAFALPTVLIALLTQFLSPYALTWSLVLCGIVLAVGMVTAFRSIVQRRWGVLTAGILGMLVAAEILGNTPALMHQSRLARKCYCDFSRDVWTHVGTRELYIWGGDESIRGALPFYGNRKLSIITSGNTLAEIAEHPAERALIMNDSRYRKTLKAGGKLAELLLNLRVYRPDFPKQADDFVVLTAPELPEK